MSIHLPMKLLRLPLSTALLQSKNMELLTNIEVIAAVSVVVVVGADVNLIVTADLTGLVYAAQRRRKATERAIGEPTVYV